MRYFILIILSGLAGFFGLAQSYWDEVTPQNQYGLFSQIGRDGWIEDGSKVILPDLNNRGNKLDITFHNWRPYGMEPAKINIFLCEKKISELVINKAFTHRIHLTGGCNPRIVRFEVLNPFSPSAKDTRMLGAQIKKVVISSKLYYPLLDFKAIAFVSLLILLLSVTFLFGTSGYSLLAYVTPLFSYALLLSAFPYRIHKLLPLWIAMFCVSIGFLFYQDIKDRKLFSPHANPILAVYAVIVTVVAFAIRFYGLSFGLPDSYHPDELAKVNAVMRMYDNGTLNPRYFLHPSLLLYSTYAMNYIYQSLGDYADFRGSLIIAGRTVSALAGTLSVYLTFLIGRRTFSSGVGVFGSIFIALSPLHITCSRYLKEDSLLLFLSLISIWLVLVAVQDKKTRALLLAGFFAGTSASVKYSGLLTVGIVFLAPWLRSRSLLPDRDYLKPTFLGLIIAPLGFLLFTPYALLDSTKFLKDFNYERKHMSKGHLLPITAWSQYWMYHLSNSLAKGMTIPIVLLSLVGVGITFIRKNWFGLFIISLFFLYYLPAEFVKAKPAPQPERYVLPCIPFLALLAAEALSKILDLKSNLRYLATVLFLFSLGLVSYRAVGLTTEITNDTREQMKVWMSQNVNEGSHIYVDHRQYSPAISPDRYKVEFAPRAQIHKELDKTELKRRGVNYLMLSSLWYDRYYSQPRTDKRVQNIIQNVFDTFPLVKEFKPKFGTYGFHNPTVRLYRIE